MNLIKKIFTNKIKKQEIDNIINELNNIFDNDKDELIKQAIINYNNNH